MQRLPARREILVDGRGHALRATWHPDQDLVVISVWHGESCAGTVQLPSADAARFGAFLLTALAESLERSGTQQAASGSDAGPERA
ncbi:MAG: hypothetical protein ACRDJ4_01270 [Actinomycetota bacterium]